ncbi:hypothetical protein [uncultured Muribaculum sp.]|uniref:hypothetical protein n=1 Tax=uncultured Muribaculum sp. TaxID=1918613 RepID=UPI0025B4AE03|nr:hypothetical protein [uncultured Muribaculum sp.]
MKSYKATTSLSINIVLPSGANKHIAFSPVTDGSSVFYTPDPDIQWGLEHHHKFGKLFILSTTDPLPAQPASAVTAQPASTASTTPSQLTTVNVTDLDDAKDYLADKFGMSRTKLRSRDSIESAAKQVGIKFNYE